MERQELAARIKEVAYLEGDFTLRSGKRSTYYFDKYLFETDPEILRELGRLLAARMGPGVDRLAGPELGAVALAASASMAANKPFVIVRSAKKAYGTGKQIEGVLEPGDVVMLVEDLVTTAGQAVEAAQALVAAGAKIDKIVAVVDREEGGRANIEAAGYLFESLFTKRDFGL